MADALEESVARNNIIAQQRILQRAFESLFQEELEREIRAYLAPKVSQMAKDIATELAPKLVKEYEQWSGAIAVNISMNALKEPANGS